MEATIMDYTGIIGYNAYSSTLGHAGFIPGIHSGDVAS